MNWLHTWAGVVLGGLLFAIFWMGTLSVFDREIDRWMMPETRLETPPVPPSLAVVQPSIDAAAAVGSPFWSATLPTDRQPTIRVVWRNATALVQRHLDPVTGAELASTETLAGTGFLFPFHHMLHIKAGRVGAWAVGIAGMAMLVLAVSGVIVHRKIFADFFTFRADKQPRRLLLDLHNVAGVLGFPFYVVISASGLIFLYMLYFPSSLTVVYQGDTRAFGREAFGSYSRPKANAPGEPPQFDKVLTSAQRLWDGESPRSIVLDHPGDKAAYVQAGRPGESRVSAVADLAYFDPVTGALFHQRRVDAPMLRAQRFISGLHLIQFRHWTLRGLYFGLGILGCLLIATGYFFWLESRRKRHEQLGLRGVRILEGLAIGGTTGLLIATCGFFVANRVLPAGGSFVDGGRAALEVWIFYLTWLATFAHAWRWPARAWADQCRTLAALAVTAVLLNWLTTGDTVWRTLAHRHLWPIAGMDILLLIGAAVAVISANGLPRRTPMSIDRRKHA